MATINNWFANANGFDQSFSLGALHAQLVEQETRGDGMFQRDGLSGGLNVGFESFSDATPEVRDSVLHAMRETQTTVESIGFEAYVNAQLGSNQDASINSTATLNRDRIISNMKSAAGLIAAAGNADNSTYSSYRQALRNQATPRQNTEFTISVEHHLDGPYGAIPTVSAENYDEKPTNGYRVLSIIYNLNAARQDLFGETLYPTYVVNPTEGGIIQTITVSNVSVWRSHERGGDAYRTGEVNIVDAYRDPSILEDRATHVIPTVLEDSERSRANFVDPAVVPYGTANFRGQAVATGIYKFGREIDIIGQSQYATSSATDRPDFTDTLDPALGLSELFYKFGDKVVRFVVNGLPTARVQGSQNSDTRDFVLNFRNSSIVITNQVRALDGSVVPAFAKLADGQALRLTLVVNGSGSLSDGNIELSPGQVRVEALVGQNGQSVSTASGIGAEIARSVVEAQPVGYLLDARLTNKNRREPGQVIHTRQINYQHPIPLGTPITSVVSTLDDRNKEQLIKGLLDATNMRNSQNAVRTLLNFAAGLRQTAAANTHATARQNGSEGILARVIRPSYRYASIDLRQNINSIRAKDRQDDVSETILSVIKSLFFQVYRESNIEAAFRVISGNLEERPKAIIATDNEIAHYLLTKGDNRTLGAYVKYDIVATTNRDFDHKIIVVPTRENPVEGDILSFGTFAYIPSFVADLPIPRAGGINLEIAAFPYNLHINNIPVLVEIDIIGLAEAVAAGPADKGITIGKPAGAAGTANQTGTTDAKPADQGQQTGGKTN